MFGPTNFYIVRNTSFTIVFMFMVLNLLNACLGTSPEDGGVRDVSGIVPVLS